MALRMRLVEELHYQQIGVRLAIPVETVGTRIFKGKTLLVGLLRKAGFRPYSRAKLSSGDVSPSPDDSRLPLRGRGPRANVGEAARAILVRATADFERGRGAEAAEGFDRLARLAPAETPHLWPPGIALYYAGRHAHCRAQFELHRTVNPHDVEILELPPGVIESEP